MPVCVSVTVPEKDNRAWAQARTRARKGQSGHKEAKRIVPLCIPIRFFIKPSSQNF